MAEPDRLEQRVIGLGPGEVRAVPGAITVLDGGVPWIREQGELDTQWARIMGTLPTLVIDGKIDPAALDGAGRALLGVLAAARWTLGRTTMAPMKPREEPVTGRALREQLAIAETEMVSRRIGWDYATGALEWILWITGAREDLAFPGLDTPSPR